MFIIADAGATKCAWKFVDDRGRVVDDLAVTGINFAHQAGRLEEELQPAAYQGLVETFRKHGGVRGPCQAAGGLGLPEGGVHIAQSWEIPQ